MYYYLANRLPGAKNWICARPLYFQTAMRLIGKAWIEVAVLRRMIRPGDVVIDVGASDGPYALLLARLVGEQGMVHAFEPVPPTFRSLAVNITASGLAARVRLNQLALGEQEGQVDIAVPSVSYEASIVPHRTSSWARSQQIDPYRCRMTTLDAYAAQHALNAVSFVKCDVEGAELLVLRGARRLLRGPVPPVLMVEAYEPWTIDFGYTPADLFAFLREEAGYVIYHCGRRRLQYVDPQGTVPGEFPHFLNFLAVVPAVHRQLLSVKDIGFPPA
jgi:FkbM family methyltransferase